MYATDSEIVSRVSHWQLEEGRVSLSDTVVVQINNSKGEYATNIHISYSKKNKLTIGDAWIEDKQGKIVRKLKKSDWAESSASSTEFYTDRYEKTAQLRHNEYPYRVVYSYQSVFSDCVQIEWDPVLFYAQDVNFAQLIIDIPLENYPVRFKNANIEDPKIVALKKQKRYIWQTIYQAQKRETYAPESELKIPTVFFVPVNFKYGVKGSWESWTTFGNWMCKLNENTTELPPEEKQVVDQLIAKASTPLEKAKILYQYLQQHTRYVNVSLKIGGVKSYSADYVAKNKYGDCKALSTYMVALLKYAGIKSYYTLIQAGETITPIDKEFPFDSFNHIIVTLPLENDTIFLECTDKNAPFGYLGTFTQGRDAFVIRPDGSFFVHTSALKPEDVACSSHISIPVGGQLTTLDCAMHLKGYAFDLLNGYAANRHKAELETAARRLISLNNYDFKSLTVSKERPEQPEITLRAEIQTSHFVKTYGNNLVLSSYPILLANIEEPAERSQGVQLYYPVAKSDTVVYNFINQSNAGKMPDDVVIHSPYGEYTVRYESTENQFRVIKNLLIFRGFYPISEYAGFYEFWSAVKKYESTNYYREKK